MAEYRGEDIHDPAKPVSVWSGVLAYDQILAARAAEREVMPTLCLGKKVRVKSVGVVGEIDAEFIEATSRQFRVVYLNTIGTIIKEYFHASQLEIVE